MENNSDKAFWDYVAPDIRSLRERADRNNGWAESRGMVNRETGEIVTDKDGKTLTLADMSKSWYSKQGARNNTFSIVKRLGLVHRFQCDQQKFRPKFITLTFASVTESWNGERAIQKFVDALRKWAKRQGVKVIPYFWTSEVQMKNSRGALHYHLLVLGAPYLPKAQAEKWWSHGFIDIRAVDDTGRAFKYLAKYLWKWGKQADEPSALPDWWFLFSEFGKRRYGFSKWFTLAPAERIPRWLKETLEGLAMLGELKKASRAEGGGWLIVLDWNGEQVEMRFPSPFQIMEIAI